ncbi:MAG: type II secretion system protein [Candidatus Omnitrophota bacterium]|nr:type II secretion system protein [Candidatus Omnitrophota bacterium]
MNKKMGFNRAKSRGLIGPKNIKSVTLIELMIGIMITGTLIVCFYGFQTFINSQVIDTDKRAKVQNELAYCLEHMVKEIGKAIGDVDNSTVDTANIGGDAAVKVRIDYKPDGKNDVNDREIAYRFTGSPTAYQIKFCPQCTNGPCTNCNPNWNSTEILSSRISRFTPTYSPADNYVGINITACWDPDGSPVICGSSGNPKLEMKNRIYMSAVSTR